MNKFLPTCKLALVPAVEPADGSAERRSKIGFGGTLPDGRVSGQGECKERKRAPAQAKALIPVRFVCKLEKTMSRNFELLQRLVKEQEINQTELEVQSTPQAPALGPEDSAASGLKALPRAGQRNQVASTRPSPQSAWLEDSPESCDLCREAGSPSRRTVFFALNVVRSRVRLPQLIRWLLAQIAATSSFFRAPISWVAPS